jgi:glycosyltransferase involved in cell wall biosynthesis
MKILVDAYSLGIKGGTGLATYTREICSVLARKHEVFPIFGLNFRRRVLSRDHRLSEFYQALSLYRQDRFAHSIIFGAGTHLLKRALRFREKPLDNIGTFYTESIKSFLPSASTYFNVPHLYSFSQAMAVVFRARTYLALKGKYDIFHCTSPLPICVRGVPKVVTCHDVIPYVAPSMTSIDIKHYLRLLQKSLNSSDLIVSVSTKTKDDLVNLLGVREEKIVVTYQSSHIPDSLKRDSPEELDIMLQAFRLKVKQYFIFYGSIEPKKNVQFLINSYIRSKTDYPLVIVGKYGWLYDDVKNFLESQSRNKWFRRNIILLPYLQFPELVAFIRGARGVLFPSHYEGFGLPVLEAMSLGVPVVTSNRPALQEVGGDAVLYVDPSNRWALKQAIERLSTDSAFREDLVERGLVQSQKFSPQLHYERLLAAYRKVL